jgi:hypothetical protein
MGRARAEAELAVPTSAAEALWYDTSRWPSFVAGLHHIVKVEGDWPRPGARVVWDSTREGRGRVVEEVTQYEVRRGQTVAVEDPRITGTQTVTFTPTADGCTVALELRYDVKHGGFFSPLVDVLFVRRAFAIMLRGTLARFRREAIAEAELAER